MHSSLFSRSILAFILLLLASVSPSLAQTGQVVEATQPVRLYLDGEQTRLSVGDTVKVGDTVLTGEGAMAQIIFQDETRIVVGPNSQMKLDSLIFRTDNTARKFAVRATRGTFRFLSGNSASKAYSVRTPIATMGVRGTVFDFTIPFARTDRRAVLNLPRRINDPMFLIKPFSQLSMLFIVGTTLFFGCCFTTEIFLESCSFWYGRTKGSVSSSRRIMILSFSLCFSLLEKFYGGALTMFLSSSPSLPFNSLEEGLSMEPEWKMLLPYCN